MTFETSKILGGVGGILMFIGVIPFLQYLWVIGLVGLILVLVALYDFAKIYKEGSIFSYAMYGVATVIIGGIITAVLAFAVVLTNLKDLITQIYPGWNGDWTSLQNITPNTSNFDPTAILPFIAGILVVLVIVWVFAIIAAFLIWRSLKQVSNKSNTGLFGTAGILLLVGAIIPVIGLILMWISALLLAIAFFTVKAPQQMPPMQPPTQPTTV